MSISLLPYGEEFKQIILRDTLPSKLKLGQGTKEYAHDMFRVILFFPKKKGFIPGCEVGSSIP